MDRKSPLIKKLREFKKEVSADFPVKKMLLFGSRAMGKRGKAVDFDLLIVSEKFNKLNFIERAARMYDYWSLEYPADFLCYTPKEFGKKSRKITIVREAVKEGIAI